MTTTNTPAVIPTSVRWLFTAKDGRVMRKSSHNSSLGALKQALLSRVLLHGGRAPAVKSKGFNAQSRDSRSVRMNVDNATSGRVFATALMDSGDNVPLDEDTWTSLVVREGGREGGATAVAALAPARGDIPNEKSRRGGSIPQRFFCEYRLKPSGSKGTSASMGTDACGTGGVATTPVQPTHTSMTTYVLVSRGLLRDVSRTLDDQEQVQNGERSPSDEAGSGLHAISEERLASRVKAVNEQVEGNLRRIVEWVQEVQRVRVLSMSATFVVVPSAANSCSHTPGVWLEQGVHVRIVPNGTKAAASPGEANCFAPIAEPLGEQGMLPQRPPERHEAKSLTKTLSANLDAGGAEQAKRCQPKSQSPRKGDGDAQSKMKEEGDFKATTRVGVDNRTVAATDAIESDTSAPPAASSSKATASPAKLSTAEMLAVAADAVLSACEASPTASPFPQRDTDSVAVDANTIHPRTVAVSQQFHGQPLSAIGVGPEAKSAGIRGSSDPLPSSLEKCGGDFCCYNAVSSARGGGTSGLSEDPPSSEKEVSQGDLDGGSGSSTREDGASRAQQIPTTGEPNWADIDVCDDPDGAGLLELVSKQRQVLSSSGGRDPAVARKDPGMTFSMTFKSIGLARLEAEKGRDAHWGEALRKHWREGSARKASGGLENLSAALVYREVRHTTASHGEEKEVSWHAPSTVQSLRK